MAGSLARRLTPVELRRRPALGRIRAKGATDKQRGPNGFDSAPRHWPARCVWMNQGRFVRAYQTERRISVRELTLRPRTVNASHVRPLRCVFAYPHACATPRGLYRTIFCPSLARAAIAARTDRSRTSHGTKPLFFRLFAQIKRVYIPRESVSEPL